MYLIVKIGRFVSS